MEGEFSTRVIDAGVTVLVQDMMIGIVGEAYRQPHQLNQ